MGYDRAKKDVDLAGEVIHTNSMNSLKQQLQTVQEENGFVERS